MGKKFNFKLCVLLLCVSYSEKFFGQQLANTFPSHFRALLYAKGAHSDTVDIKSISAALGSDFKITEEEKMQLQNLIASLNNNIAGELI